MAGAGPSASCVLKLLALGWYIGFGVTERFQEPGQMPVHVSVLARTRKQHGATALGGAQVQLLEDVDLAPSLEDVAQGTAVHTKCTQPSDWAPPGHVCHEL